jgi:hypothetical protein
MPTKKPTGSEIHEFKKNNPDLTWSDVGEHYGEKSENLRNREQNYRRKSNRPSIGRKKHIDEDKRPAKNTHQVKFTDKGSLAEAYSISNRINTLEKLVEACKADLTKWRVTKYIANVWEMGRKKKVVDITWKEGVMDGFVDDSGDWQLTDLWQVKAWFEPRQAEPIEKALEALIERVKTYAPIYEISSQYKPINDDGYLLVPNLYDAHFGKRSRNSGYTIYDARDDFIKIVKAIVGQVSSGGRPISRIMFPVGNDLLHVDNLKDTTTAGTWVEMSADIRATIEVVCEAVTQAIEIFATLAPVDVIPVEGNHDQLQTYWLSKYLDAFFSRHQGVNVYDLTSERQYYQWGRVGLGLTHKAKSPQELATLFPVEARKMWADIEWSEWLTGHFHHQRGALYAVDSIRGTVIRTIPALCNMDNYHSLHLFVGSHRAAEVMYYHKENGPAGIFPVFVSELN